MKISLLLSSQKLNIEALSDYKTSPLIFQPIVTSLKITTLK